MRRDWLLIGARAVLIAMPGDAWLGGGEELLRPISKAVQLPGVAQ